MSQPLSEAISGTPSSQSESAESPSSQSAATKLLKRKTSEVWEFFTVNEDKAECQYCKRQYKYIQGGTTSTLIRHVKSCGKIKRAKGITTGLIPITECLMGENEVESMGFYGGGKYDHMKNRELLAKMIMVHELPFVFVEYKSFNIFMKYNNPLYQTVTRNTIKKECVKIFENEKDKIKKIFRGVDRISLTSDCWTSNQTIGYMCLTAHYIDAEWNLQKRIISFNELSPPHSGDVIADAISETLVKWGIEDKVGTITLDNATNNDKAAGILKLSFELRNKLHFLGFFFHIRCCAHILNLVVQDGLNKIEKCLVKIREAVKYLRKSPGRLLKFGEIATQLGISTARSLCTDVKTRWNSTYRMLDSALHYKKAFGGYALRDSNFEWKPEEIEWEKAKKVCKLLEVFNDATDVFSGTSYPTANLFLIEMLNVKKAIFDAFHGEDSFSQEMSMAMYEKFEKYWGEINGLMAVASILDPRLKMISIRFCYERLYPNCELKARVTDVLEKLQALYELYAKEYMASTGSGSRLEGSPVVVTNTQGAKKTDFWQYVESTWNETSTNTELDNYLNESIFQHRDKAPFDVLKWWKTNSVRFPILSKLARDILSVPISTVASESAFSAGGRVLDDYRSSLTKDMVEVLVCGGDWIRANRSVELHTLQQAFKVEETLDIQVPMSTLNVN